jgi:hypothetical protein
MKSAREVAHARLRNQRLASTGFTTPEDTVSWLGAVQAQEYPGAKWGLALRMRRPSDAVIERAFAAGRILRTHVMRPTWHFVTPADIRWMLALTAPRVRIAVSHYDRQLAIDAAVVRRSNKAIAAALRGGVELTRQELKMALRNAGTAADGVLDGRVVGGWKQTRAKGKLTIAVDFPVPLNRRDRRLVANAASRFGAFFGIDVALARK